MKAARWSRVLLLGGATIGIVSTAVLYPSCGGSTPPVEPTGPQDWPVGTGDAQTSGVERTVRGTVVENVRECTIDLTCFLQMRLSGGTISIVYGTGRFDPCPNGNVEGAFALVKGDEVVVFGEVTGYKTMSTCESDRYYIRKVE